MPLQSSGGEREGRDGDGKRDVTADERETAMSPKQRIMAALMTEPRAASATRNRIASRPGPRRRIHYTAQATVHGAGYCTGYCVQVDTLHSTLYTTQYTVYRPIEYRLGLYLACAR